MKLLDKVTGRSKLTKNLLENYSHITFLKGKNLEEMTNNTNTLENWSRKSLKSLNKNLDKLTRFNERLVVSIDFILEVDPPIIKEDDRYRENGQLIGISYEEGTHNCVKVYEDDHSYGTFVHEAVHGYENRLKRLRPDMFAEFTAKWHSLVPAKVYLGDDWESADTNYMAKCGFVREYSSKNITEDIATLVESVAEKEGIPLTDILKNKIHLLFEYGFLGSN